jgi:CDP-diglyceride synthetase
MREQVNPWVEWIGRIIGGLIVATIAYFSMSFLSMWDDISQPFRLGIAGLIGFLFAIFGKCIWSWIDAIIDWT